MRKLIFGIVLNLVAVLPHVAQAQEVVIAALGDSLTAGYGLPPEDGFVPQLQSWLDAKGAQVKLINAGVSGDTIAGGLARVDWTLTPEVDGMIVALGGNDMLRGLQPEASRSNLEDILKAAQNRDVDVLLVGIAAPNNYGPDYKAAFDAMYPELASAYSALFMPDFFEGLGASSDPAKAQPFLQSDGIHPNAAGVRLIIEGFGPHVLELIDVIKQ